MSTASIGFHQSMNYAHHNIRGAIFSLNVTLCLCIIESLFNVPFVVSWCVSFHAAEQVTELHTTVEIVNIIR